MATALSSVVYPFDPTGLATSNLIVGEQQIITGANFRDYHWIIPKLAPFFADSMQIQFQDTNGIVRTLVEGVDYYLTHWFIAASRACAKDVFGSISFLDTMLTGVVTLRYQTLGGDWTQDDATLSQILANNLANPRITAWDVIVNMPYSFPVIDHQWDLVDMVGETDVVNALGGIEQALRETGQTGLTDHINNHSNPHMVTAAQVGAYSTTQMDALLANKVDTTGVAYDSARFGGQLPADFTASVLSGTAANANALGGMDPNAYKSWVIQGITPQMINTYSTAQIDQMLAGKLAIDGTAVNTAKFNNMDPNAYAAFVLQGKAADTALFNGMTPDQFAAYANAQASNTYSQAQIDSMLANKLDVTATAANSTLFGGQTPDAYKTSVLSGTAANANEFGGMDINAYAAFVLQGTAANSNQFGGYTPDNFKTWVLQGTAADSTKFNGQTYSDFMSSLDQRYAPIAAGDFRHQAQAYTSASGTDPYLWTPLGIIDTPDPAKAVADLPDLQWMVTGGDSAPDTGAALFYMRCSVRNNAIALSARLLDDVDNTATFGYTVDPTSTTGVNQVTIWLRTKDNRNPITVTELSKGVGTIYDATSKPYPVETEPTSITYVTNDRYALQSEVAAAFDQLTTAFNNLQAEVLAG